ncbi:type IV secretory system conjugative DNA transfer family protein [Actinomycetospora chibensis]|uniref:Type IV secretory system conjugative DNA transfer family protein n=1 Tax=Actinomycetospora chibensis TaxID=663606 RepID=A0ABV9RL74_9PSEU|nr:type IV secretory system conjugative DNA transfer family protein [Actinomycetospora chibensis]MDD7922795.1 type IV secretory system conjugative DNA transfer family protein [Actinomycetospora chibensis]
MISTLLILVLMVGLTALLVIRGAIRQALVCGAFTSLPATTLVQALPWPVWVIAGAVLLLLGWHRWSRSRATVLRWSARSRRRAGVASSLDVARHAGTVATRRRACTVRPSLASLSRRERLGVPTSAVGVELCRVGVQRVWSSIEDVTLVFGGPRTGKTGWLAGRVLDAPGAAVVTSTRTDLLELCAPIRQKTRGPVFVFNPVGLGGLRSTISFDPLIGCTDPVTAMERATDMVSATSRAGSGDAERWDAQARRVLAALLHAAALGGGSMRDVLGWVADNARAAREVPALLRRSQVESFEKAAEQFVETNDRTRTSITNSIMPALGWLNHPDAAAAAAPTDQLFDVEELLSSRATVFLLGAEEADTGSLVCALTGHIAREARRLAVAKPSGRLDPPLLLALDEAALISPVPLENWTADMGGRGVTIIAPFQSRAQLLARYGEHKTATILNNTGSVLLFGGTRDQADLQFWSTLAGERDERITTTDMRGRVASKTVRKVPVLAPAQLANLPAGKVVVYRRGIAPVIGRARMAWTRCDVRAQRQLVATGWRGRWQRARAWADVGVGALRRRVSAPRHRASAIGAWWHRLVTARRRTTPGPTPRSEDARPLVIDVDPVAPPVLGEQDRNHHGEGTWLR